MRTIVQISEKALQYQICQHLTLLRWFCIQYGKPGGHGPLKGAVPPGHPDICAIKGGRHVWLEVKTPTGTVTESQQRFHADLFDALAECYVVRSVAEAEAAVNGPWDTRAGPAACER